ncbi:ATP-binding protein [Halomicrobium urmianum]|uniref:ATP-binding protein n=1 Tax=Halomicrobium urmianum TaxID=1586233 RepID=UPI001CD9BE94|nr:ATP-binding protein [Halomicrobium urmianum]
MDWLDWSPTGHRGRSAIVALGTLYTALALVYPFLPGIETERSTVVIILLLVGGAGLTLLAGGYRLPRTEIDSNVFPVVLKWCLGGIGVMLALLGLVAVVDGLRDPLQDVLILTALGSVAGLTAGTYDGRARTRARELEETVAELRESENRYRTFAENFPNGAVALLDDELRHTMIGGQGFEKIGFSADDFRGERMQDAYPADMLETVAPEYRAALNGKSSTFEVDIEDRVFEFRAHPMTTDNSVSGVLVMSQDVTERKQRERELVRRANQQQVVADLGQLALEANDVDRLMHEATRKVADTLDVDYCKVLDMSTGGHHLELSHGVGWRDGLVGDATVSAVEADSQAAYTLEHERPVVVEDLQSDSRFDGPELLTDHDVRSGVSTIIGPFDEPWGILGAHDTSQQTFTDEDVSFVQSVANVLAEAIERRQYQEELEELIDDLETSNERLEQFAYAASHDLQEPLRMVSSYLHLIERRYEDELDDEGQEFLEFAVDGADRMRAMIDGLLEYSRVETDGQPLEPTDLDAVLDDVRTDLQVKIEENDATITADHLPRIAGDPDQLREVFQNLLENAIKYSGDEPPQIHIAAERTGSEWTISVRDEGIGIDLDDQDRMFEVFERAHSRSDYSGSGIGLAVCQRIVERHGGDIWIDSEAEEGTTVSFTLAPISEADEHRARGRAS